MRRVGHGLLPAVDGQRVLLRRNALQLGEEFFDEIEFEFRVEPFLPAPDDRGDEHEDEGTEQAFHGNEKRQGEPAGRAAQRIPNRERSFISEESARPKPPTASRNPSKRADHAQQRRGPHGDAQLVARAPGFLLAGENLPLDGQAAFLQTRTQGPLFEHCLDRAQQRAVGGELILERLIEPREAMCAQSSENLGQQLRAVQTV